MARVLVLSPYPELVSAAIEATGDEVLVTTDRLDVPGAPEADWLVSFGYRHILRAPTLARYGDRAVNLHVSLLPWNRGADPNFWSWFDATPKGVTVHRLDVGLDTGPLLAQRGVTFAAASTLASSYDALRAAMVELFADAWPDVRAERTPARVQEPGGTLHRARDKEPFMAQLPLGWATPVADVEALGRRHRALAENPEIPT